MRRLRWKRSGWWRKWSCTRGTVWCWWGVRRSWEKRRRTERRTRNRTNRHDRTEAQADGAGPGDWPGVFLAGGAREPLADGIVGLGGAGAFRVGGGDGQRAGGFAAADIAAEGRDVSHAVGAGSG